MNNEKIEFLNSYIKFLNMKKTFEEIKFKAQEKEFPNKELDLELLEICKSEISFKNVNFQKTENISNSDVLYLLEKNIPIDVISRNSVLIKMGDDGWL